MGLSWENIDLDHKTLTVKRQLCREKKKGGKYYFSPPKNNKSRVLTLAPSVVQLFRWQKLKQNGDRLKAGEAWEETGLVFTNPTGGCLSYRTVYDCFKLVMKKLGLPDVRFHDLRHPNVKPKTHIFSKKKTFRLSNELQLESFLLKYYRECSSKVNNDQPSLRRLSIASSCRFSSKSDSTRFFSYSAQRRISASG